ncbi:MAG: amidase, partial [Rhizobiaceae bacterium]|nr:amidase [Rhizobiaceae bacterium]
MSASSDLLARPIAELGRLIRARKISCGDLVEACLEREAATRNLNAYTELFAEEARSVAEASQTLLDRSYDLGPLHGIPVALKGNIAVKGRRTTAGSRILADHVPDADAAMVRR